MIYISLDIETTGLDPIENDVLEVGAYIENSKNPLPREQLPAFRVYVWKEVYRGNAYAMVMNTRILQKILDLKKAKDAALVKPEEVGERFSEFLYQHKSLWPNEKFNGYPGPFALAGKNLAGFDIPFLNQLPNWKSKTKFHHRIMDPAPLYFDNIQDEVIPDLSLCKKRAGLPEPVIHETLDDAWDVISLIRNKFPVVV